MQLTTEATALLVIDMQQGFLSPGGSVARIGFPVQLLAPAVPGCARLLAAARAAGVPVAHTRYVYQPGHKDGGVMVEHLLPELKAERALVAGDPDADIIPLLEPRPGEAVFDKNRPSAFFAPGFADWLAGAGIRRVVVAGVTTNCCIETTVRDLSQRDFEVFVVEDAVAEYDPARHAHALEAMGLLFARRVTVAEVEAAFAMAAGRAAA
ncbi:MAG: cysteine hydrolase family protein [Sphingomonadaceae bacterium]